MNNRVFRFFQELNKRNVLRVIAMYAGSAFVLWDVANNVVEPMNLPEWIPRIVIWVSLIGFPLIAIISWLYDFKGGVPGLSKKISTHSQYEGDDNSSNH